MKIVQAAGQQIFILNFSRLQSVIILILYIFMVFIKDIPGCFDLELCIFLNVLIPVKIQSSCTCHQFVINVNVQILENICFVFFNVGLK